MVGKKIGISPLMFQLKVSRTEAFRSTLETRHAAFIGGVEQALPHFTNREGVCDQLSPMIGDFSGSKDTRWEKLINSECRTGSEFAESWNIIKEEVSECHRYLEKSMDLSPMNISARGQ